MVAAAKNSRQIGIACMLNNRADFALPRIKPRDYPSPLIRLIATTSEYPSIFAMIRPVC